jgi:hypothetical protein
MRVLHVGNFGSRPKGAHLHSIAPKLSRGLIRLGHHVVDFADRDIARAGTPFGHRKLGFLAVNWALDRLVHTMQPDLLLLGHADTIHTRLLLRLRRELPRLRVVQWNVDPLFDPQNFRRIESKLCAVDATLVSTAGDLARPLRRPGMRLGFLPNPVDASVESGAAHLHSDLPYDVFFACGHPARPKRRFCGRAWDMAAFFAGLVRDIQGLRPCLAGFPGHPHLCGQAYQAALSSCAMGLNVSERNDLLLYSSDRLAHMAGNGEAILIDRATGYDRLFAPDAMAFFSSLEELTAHVRRLAADPAARQHLAARGYARYHELFNEVRIARYVTEIAMDTHCPDSYEWPTLIT